MDPWEVVDLRVASQCVEEEGSAEDQLEEVDLCLEEGAEEECSGEEVGFYLIFTLLHFLNCKFFLWLSSNKLQFLLVCHLWHSDLVDVSWTGRGGFRGRLAFAGRGRGRGRGRGVGRPAVTREQLDNQLDAYMSKTKGHLDAELDAYMAQADPDSMEWRTEDTGLCSWSVRCSVALDGSANTGPVPPDLCFIQQQTVQRII